MLHLLSNYLGNFYDISKGATVNSARGELRIDEDAAPVQGVGVLADVCHTVIKLGLAQCFNHFLILLRLALRDTIVCLIEVFSELCLIVLLSFPNG